MKITCIDCGRQFEFSEGEIRFYLEKGFSYPKRCKECRKYRDNDTPKVKTSSIYSNASLYGMPYPIEGGTEIVYEYEIHIIDENGIRYLNRGVNHKCILTKDSEKATQFSSKEAHQIVEIYKHKIAEMYPNAEIKIIPNSHYETIHKRRTDD